MASGNYSIVKAINIKSFKFGDTAWSDSDFTSTATPLDDSFATNNPTPLADLVGIRDSNNPVQSDAFVKSISFSGNERTVDEEDLIGADATGAQNKEVVGGSVSKVEVELTIVYRNNVPLSLFNDTTKCALMEVDTEESSSTGKMNFAMNNIQMVHVGSLSQNPDGLMEQKVKFSFAGGLTGSPISVNTGSETWSRVAGGDYAEEVRTS